MMNRIGDFESFDPLRKREPTKSDKNAFQEKLQKIEKTEEERERDKEKLYQPFLTEKMTESFPQNSNPSFFAATPSKGPAELILAASEARPANMAIPPNTPPEGLEFFVDKMIATPPKYPPPTVDHPTSKPSSYSAKDLPQSDYFWQDFSMPDEPPPHRNFEEAEEPNQVSGRMRRTAGSERSNRSEKKKLDSQQELLAAVQPKKEDKEEKDRDASSSLILPNPLPLQFASIAKNATMAAASYLNPVTETLFREIVGSLAFFQKTTSGITRTEILLNASDFNKSPFFNTTIVIEQHASAPGSFNICLQGSPQAVQIFNDNLSNLTSAFTAAYESKEIDFRIGRLETALSSDWSTGSRKKRSESSKDDDHEGFEE